MKLKKSTRVIYFTPKGDQIYTVIKEVNDKRELYTLDFNDQLVSENEVKLNTHSIFSVPSSMPDDNIVNYHYNHLVNHILFFLKSNNPYHDINVFKENASIYFETTIDLPKTPEEKKHFREQIDKLNGLIGQVNSQIKSRFNKHMEVNLKLPVSIHHLHTIRV
ncbi:hypothetical protein [Pedobacter foliorum]|uniref:hypothetical protein n=1 Tax=Pedobacter foliorum TaxID=2739058 RepID=UPI0015634C0F|nr:hypothetical protein [Pedobacter foliorum]NRF40174.1 hypothetical protein [Pedobacter foliorum]